MFIVDQDGTTFVADKEDKEDGRKKSGNHELEAVEKYLFSLDSQIKSYEHHEKLSFNSCNR